LNRYKLVNPILTLTFTFTSFISCCSLCVNHSPTMCYASSNELYSLTLLLECLATTCVSAFYPDRLALIEGVVRARAGCQSVFWVVDSPSPEHHRPALALPAPSRGYKTRPCPQPFHSSSYPPTTTKNRPTVPLISLSPYPAHRDSTFILQQATVSWSTSLDQYYTERLIDLPPYLHDAYQVDRRA
jgi:hypothetical protein